jgi:NAD(P)H-quinone oxidoreductase subunit 5
VGGQAHEEPAAGPTIVAGEARRRLYRAALERGYLDGLLDAWLVSPIQRVFRQADRLERRLVRWLGGPGAKQDEQ